MEVSDKVLEQFKDVRESGETNMLDAKRVQVLAQEKGHHTLVSFLGDNPSIQILKIIKQEL